MVLSRSSIVQRLSPRTWRSQPYILAESLSQTIETIYGSLPNGPVFKTESTCGFRAIYDGFEWLVLP